MPRWLQHSLAPVQARTVSRPANLFSATSMLEYAILLLLQTVPWSYGNCRITLKGLYVEMLFSDSSLHGSKIGVAVANKISALDGDASGCIRLTS